MSEIDRVFARMGGGKSSPTEQREVRSIPRKGSAGGGTRVVEVVRLPSREAGPARDHARRAPSTLRAATWDEGFPARTASAPGPIPEVAAPDPEAPVVHVMPAWEPSVPDVAVEPPPMPTERASRAARPVARRVADPFDAEDDGANCLRCGYLVEPGREKRGLTTCAACG